MEGHQIEAVKLTRSQSMSMTLKNSLDFKGIVHFEIIFWYALTYLFVSAVVSILIFLVKPFVSISHIMEDALHWIPLR